MKLAFCLIMLISLHINAQQKKGQFELSGPLNPWVILTRRIFLQGEYSNSKIRSTTAVLGYQGTGLYFSYFNKVQKFTGYRADFGQRWYLLNKLDKYIRPYAGINISAEYSTYKLIKDYNVPIDSLITKGLSIGPEINAGIKFVILKRLTISPSLGLRYYFTSHPIKNITKNPKYWSYNDWDNNKGNWEDNRTTIASFRKGFLPIPYINIGGVIKL